MTTVKRPHFSILVASFLPALFTISWALFTGSWCPYQVEKIIPCRVRNGSEAYFGPSLCWRNENGSYACTKKLLYRPKYITTHKKIMETKYKCCPGMVGSQCEKECFNCSSYERMEQRVSANERRLSRLEKSLPRVTYGGGGGVEKLDRFHRDYLSHNNVFPPPSKEQPEASNSLAYVTMNLRIQGLLDEFREMQNRIRLLENELSRLNTQVDDLTLNNYNDYGGGGGNSVPAGGISHGKDNGPPVANKDNPTTTASLDSTEKDVVQSTPSHHHHRHGRKGDHIFRVLEENLERGDIASTLNDDYGDELYNDNSTEQYIDQLTLKREHSP